MDDHFVNSVRSLLQGFEPVVIEPEELIAKLDAMGPSDVNTFKNRLLSIVDAYTRGKDVSKLRIIVKKQ